MLSLAAAVTVPCLLCEGEKGRERKAGQDRASCVTGAEEPIQLALSCPDRIKKYEAEEDMKINHHICFASDKLLLAAEV